ncbi:TPA: sugar transferase [Campylobacter jejuni]
MFDSNSAVERIKNHLAYKLGQAMIDFKQNWGGVSASNQKTL